MDSLVNLVQEKLINKNEFPSFSAGDTLTVTIEIREGDKVRPQSFKGVVIQVKGRGQSQTFTIRKMSGTVGVERIFCLTFQTEFFGRHGFVEIEGTPVAPDVYQELLRSYDAGVAEFLDLEAAKPNTLGNTRMLLTL